MTKNKQAANKSTWKNAAPEGKNFEYRAQLLSFKKNLIREAIKHCKGHKGKAALLLGIAHPYMNRILKK
jgi:DNA-binding NtrC family response regulator